MISKFAMDEIETMIEDGLKPTPRDIVRLNALALKIEEARGKDVTNAEYLLPRVAWLRDGVYFRQPTVAHEIWLESVYRWVKSDDFDSFLAISCYALSRSADELPPADDPSNLAKAIAAYSETMGDFTVDQLYAAVKYVKHGCNHIEGEHAPAPEKTEDVTETTESLDVDWDECVAIGVLREGAAVLWGLSLSDMKRMTRDELESAIRRAYFFHDRERSSAYAETQEHQAQARYYRAKYEIIERLRNGTAASSV